VNENGFRMGIYIRIPEVGDLLQTTACRAIQPEKQVGLAFGSPLHRNDFLVGVRLGRICCVFEAITPFHLNRQLDPVPKERQDEIHLSVDVLSLVAFIEKTITELDDIVPIVFVGVFFADKVRKSVQKIAIHTHALARPLRGGPVVEVFGEFVLDFLAPVGNGLWG
jgi:hypothetical protein